MNRGDIADVFSVSIVQASKDLRVYRDLLPNNMVYDSKLKSYITSLDFTPGIIQPSPEQYLRDQSQVGASTAVMPLPGRHIDPIIFRTVLLAVKNDTPIRITYQSLSRPHPFSRVFRPHTFVSDGRRWHVRGFCGESGGYRDFLLARISEASLAVVDTDLLGVEEDVFWNNEIHVKLGPHPGLTKSQQGIIERDFGMTEGQVIIPLRQAYLLYFLRHLDLLEETDQARKQQMTIHNRDEVDRWYQEIMAKKGEGE